MNDESLYAHVCLGRLGCSGKNRMDEVLSCAQKKDRHTKSFACLTEWDNEHGVPSGAKLFFLIFCWTWCKCHFSCKLPFLVRFTTELQTLKNELQEALSEALAETVSLWRSNVFPGDFLRPLWTLKVWREKTPEPKRWSAWREAQMELQNNCRISMISNFKFLTTLRKPAGRLGVVSPCERSENKEGVWGRGVVDTGAFFGRNRRCLGWRFWVSGSRLYH